MNHMTSRTVTRVAAQSTPPAAGEVTIGATPVPGGQLYIATFADGLLFVETDSLYLPGPSFGPAGVFTTVASHRVEGGADVQVLSVPVETGVLLVTLSQHVKMRKSVSLAEATAPELEGATLKGPLKLGPVPEPKQGPTGPYASLKPGEVSVFQFGYGLAAPTMHLQVAASRPDMPSPACLNVEWEATHGGGEIARVIDAVGVLVNTSNDPKTREGPATNHWCLGTTHYSDAVAARGANGRVGGSQHGALYGQVVRTAPKGGFAPGRTGAELWSLWLTGDDGTGAPSSIGGSLTGIEMDFAATGADDGDCRYGIQFTLATSNTNKSGYCEFARFLYVNGRNAPGDQTWFKSILQLDAPYTVSAIDLSQGTQGIGHPLTKAPNASVAIKLRAGQKLGLDGDGLSGTYFVRNEHAQRTELWARGELQLSVSDAGAISTARSGAAAPTLAQLGMPAVAGQLAYARDVRNAGEAPGGGSGQWVFAHGGRGALAWCIVGTTTQAAA